ncbi:MAG: LysM peptidoglycan-binding domain-containing protein [Promicromonosporaceae bacterium]|nr:LysM peptidoglycan-binding domain-containing protein [Promicromonosporaceae bacterium]
MVNGRASRSVAGLTALAAGLGGASVALTARAVQLAEVVTAPGARVDTWVELGVVAPAALLAAWAALGAFLGLAVVASARAGVRWRAGEAAVRRVAPGVVHRLVRAGVGIGVGAGLALGPTAAFAAPPAPGPAAVEVVGQAAGGLDLAWRPTAVAPATATAAPKAATTAPAPPRPPAPAPAASAPTAAVTVIPAPAPPATAAPMTVVVLRGDTLWDIAAAHLDPGATDAQILAATVRWHQANRAVIGDDPDVILPGQILTQPA